MEAFLTSVFIAAVVFLLTLWLFWMKRANNPIPGPRCLPIVGYLPYMTSKPYEKLVELSKTYGPMYKIRLGMRNVLVLCDFKSIKEAFSSDAFVGRPDGWPLNLSETTIETGAFTNLPWKEQRRFALHMLKDLGFGRTKMEDLMKEEILDILDRLKDVAGGNVKMSDLLAPSMSNNISSLLFGRRMRHDDPKRIRLNRMLSDAGRLAGAITWQNFFPLIRSFSEFFRIGNQGKLSKAVEEIRQFMIEEVNKHESTLDPNNIRDFIDAYLIEINKRKNDPNSAFHKDVLIDMARLFFGAGSETVRISLDWMLLLAAAYPDVQQRIQGEIDEALGADAFATGNDRLRMPYTEAAIHEMWRWSSMIPVILMRYTLQDTELNGYFVPRHTHVLAVLYGVTRNAEVWGEDVLQYKPERFLSEDGKKLEKPEHAIPFSVGKRACPGKPLAEIEVFLYVVAILQKFNVSVPPGKKIDFEGVLGIGLQPKRQELRVTLRHT